MMRRRDRLTRFLRDLAALPLDFWLAALVGVGGILLVIGMWALVLVPKEWLPGLR